MNFFLQIKTVLDKYQKLKHWSKFKNKKLKIRIKNLKKFFLKN